MTSVILFKKMLSMECSENMSQIKYLKMHNMKKIRQTQKSLQQLLKTSIKYKNCRLCLRPAERNIFHNDANISIVDTIKDIFSIEIKEDDGKPQDICTTCENVVLKAAELKKVAEATQWRLQQEIETEHVSMAQDTLNCNYENTDDCTDVNNYSSDESEKNISQEIIKKKVYRRRPANMRPCICEICGVEVKTLNSLKTHRLVHSTDFSHSCPHCQFKASNPYSLRIHVRAHTGVRPYKCEECPATFVSTSNLASHKRKHQPPSCICEICKKAFKFKQALVDHIATQHRNVKPYSCCSCENSFATVKQLRTHELKVHNRPKMRIGATPNYIRLREEAN